MHFCVPPLSGLPGRKRWGGLNLSWSRACLLKQVCNVRVVCIFAALHFSRFGCQDPSTTPSGLRQRWASLSKSEPVTVVPLPTSGDPTGSAAVAGAPVLPVRALHFPPLQPPQGLPTVPQHSPAPSVPAPASRWSGLGYSASYRPPKVLSLGPYTPVQPPSSRPYSPPSLPESPLPPPRLRPSASLSFPLPGRPACLPPATPG